MSKIPELTTPTHSDEQWAEQKRAAPSSLWQRVALGGIMLISLFMNFYKLGQHGFDLYYPPAVRSMMDNWHNFFFAAYDPGGFTSIDKPPVGFWLQVLSAKIFGFNAVSVLLPQALCGRCCLCSCSTGWCDVTSAGWLADGSTGPGDQPGQRDDQS